MFDCALPPLVTTTRRPERAPGGMTTVRESGRRLFRIRSCLPARCTVTPGMKSRPRMLTLTPGGPLTGETLEIAGARTTSKCPLAETRLPPRWTPMRPLWTPAGSSAEDGVLGDIAHAEQGAADERLIAGEEAPALDRDLGPRRAEGREEPSDLQRQDHREGVVRFGASSAVSAEDKAPRAVVADHHLDEVSAPPPHGQPLAGEGDVVVRLEVLPRDANQRTAAAAPGGESADHRGQPGHLEGPPGEGDHLTVAPDADQVGGGPWRDDQLGAVGTKALDRQHLVTHDELIAGDEVLADHRDLRVAGALLGEELLQPGRADDVEGSVVRHVGKARLGDHEAIADPLARDADPELGAAAPVDGELLAVEAHGGGGIEVLAVEHDLGSRRTRQGREAGEHRLLAHRHRLTRRRRGLPPDLVWALVLLVLLVLVLVLAVSRRGLLAHLMRLGPGGNNPR